MIPKEFLLTNEPAPTETISSDARIMSLASLGFAHYIQMRKSVEADTLMRTSSVSFDHFLWYLHVMSVINTMATLIGRIS
jgi:hypothetical protein